MTSHTAHKLIGSTVVAWDQDSSSYLQGKLVEVFEDSDQAKIQLSKNTSIVVDLGFVSEGEVEELVETSETEIPRDYSGFSDQNDDPLELI